MDQSQPLSLHALCLPDQALQKAGLCGAQGCTRLLVLHPRTLSDVMDAILEVTNHDLIALQPPSSPVAAPGGTNPQWPQCCLRARVDVPAGLGALACAVPS